MRLAILKNLIVILFVVLMVSGCTVNSELKTKDLYGTYNATFPGIKATLILEDNGMYKQFFALENNKIYKAKGKWSYDTKDGYINLDKAMVLRSWGRTPETSIARAGFDAYVEAISPNDITIVTNSDLGYFYTKQ